MLCVFAQGEGTMQSWQEKQPTPTRKIPGDTAETPWDGQGWHHAHERCSDFPSRVSPWLAALENLLSPLLQPAFPISNPSSTSQSCSEFCPASETCRWGWRGLSESHRSEGITEQGREERSRRAKLSHLHSHRILDRMLKVREQLQLQKSCSHKLSFLFFPKSSEQTLG